MDNRLLKSRLGLKLLGPFLLIAAISLLGAAVTIIFGYRSQRSFIEQLLLTGVTIFFFLIGLIVPLIWLFTLKRVIYPLILLKDGVTRLAQGDEHSIEITTNDELEDLAKAFNLMSANFFSSQKASADATNVNAALIETTQRNLAELSILYLSIADVSSTLAVTDILSNLAERMISILPADECAISQYDEMTQTLETIYENQLPLSAAKLSKTYPSVDYPVITKVLQTQNSAVINIDDPNIHEAEKEWIKAWGFASILLLPLVVRDKTIGLIELYAKDAVSYRPDEVNLAQTLANHAAIALQNAQLYKETDDQLNLRVKELSGLQKVTRELNSTLVLDDIIRLVIKEAVRATGADFGNVSLYDPNAHQLTTHVHEGWPQEAIDAGTHVISATSGIIGRVLGNKTSEIVPDVTNDPDYVPFPRPASSEMAIPIRYADMVEGIINLESSRVAAFTQEQLRYVEALADQAAIAIRNAKEHAILKEERRRANTRIDQLARLSEISRAFRANLDLEYILEDIAFAIQETMSFNTVLLSVVKRDQLHCVAGAGIPLIQLDSVKKSTCSISEIEDLLQPEFKLGDSFLIPQDQRGLLGAIPPLFANAEMTVEPQYKDVWQPQDLLLTPLNNTENHLIGLLFVTLSENRDRPAEQLVATLEIFANQAAMAIENASLFQEVQHRITQLKLFSQISAHISAILNPAEIFSEVVNLIANAFKYYHIQVYQVNEYDPTYLICKHRAGTALISTQVAISKGHLPIVDGSIVGWVANNHRLLCVNDVGQDPRFQSQPDLPETRSEIALPIRAGKTIFGVLDIQHNEANVFTEDDTYNLQALADQLAVATQNARLFDEALQREHLSSALSRAGLILNETLDPKQISDIICQEALEAFQVDITFLWLADDDHIYGAAGSGRNKDQFIGQTIPLSDTGILEVRIVQSRRAEFINEADFGENKVSQDLVKKFEVRSLLGAPLIVGERTLGAIMLIDCQNPNRFDFQDQISATLLANQAAIALDNARLFEQEQRRVTELNILNQTGQAINATTDLDTLMKVIHKQVGQVMNVDNMFIALYHSETNMITFPLARGGPNEKWEPRVAGNGMTEYIIRHKKPLLLNGDIAQQLTGLGIDQIGQATKSWLGVPMISGDTVLGVIALQDYKDEKTYSENDLNILSTIAAQAAIALQNTQLLSNTQTQAKQMRRLYELGVSVSQEYDLKQILKLVIQEALVLTGTQLGTIWVWDEEIEQYLAESAAEVPEYTEVLLPVFPEPDALASQVLDHHEPIIINDLVTAPHIPERFKNAGVVASIGIPIKVGEQTIGAMLVYSLRPHKFNDHDLNLLQFLATQTSVTIRNVQLVSRLNKFTEELEKRVEERTEALEHILQELRQERDRVDTLYHIARQLSTSLDLDRVLNEALHLLARAIPITQGSILLITPGTDHLVYRAALGRRRPLPRGGKQTKYKIGVGLAGHVLETRQSKIVHNLLEDDSWIPDDKELVHRSVLAVPLITSYEALGVLMLFHTQPNHFTNDHLSMVTAAAPMIATAISNADLYTLITQQSERVGILLRSVQAEAIKNEAIVEGITDGVLVVDADDSIQLVNPAAARILGVPQEELQDRKLDTILAEMTSPVDQQLAQKLYQVVTTQQANLPEQGETFVERITVEDKTIIASLTSISLTSNPKTPSSILIVLRDISQEAELDRIKNEFISTVSHELRTPMTSIKGYIDLLVTNKVGSLTDMQRKFLQIIKSNADRLSALVNDILDISRLDAGRVKLEQQSINLDTVIRSVAASFNHQLEEKNLSLRLDISDNLPLAYADPDRVTQVLVNLIGNATKYSRPNDSITITVEVVDQYFQIKVRDTGLGISEEDQKRVFDRFFRAERDANSLVDGTGLGLPIAKMFVEMMGGTIWVESELGKGSTFSFTLPLEPQIAKEEETIDLLSDKRCILVVDDNEDVLTLLKQQLEEADYQVITAAKSNQVLTQAKKYQPSLITLDIILDNTDGFEILEQLKADPETKDIPVVIASVLTNIRNKSLALGAADYIVKPFDKEQVLKAVQRLIEVVKPHHTNKRFKKILVVDDDKDIVRWLKEALGDYGFDVSGAYNGQEALLLIQEKQPDLILLDLKMPNMDGFAVIEKLRAEDTTANIPVIVITGSSIDKKHDKIKVLGLGTGHLITKPFTFSELVLEIKRLEQSN